jgi:hypothetical protein
MLLFLLSFYTDLDLMIIWDTPLVTRCDIRFISLSPHFVSAGPDVEIAPPIGETKLFLACPSVFCVRGKIKCKHFQTTLTNML